MSLYQKIIIIILGLAYLVSPWDILPEILTSYLGLIDDGLVIFVIYYLIRYDRFPDFAFFKQFNKAKANQKDKQHHNINGQSQTRQQTKTEQQPHAEAGKRASVKTPYEILDILPGASKQQIQTAYKKAIKKYHPDKVAHLGKEFSDLANTKFLEIQKAYDQLINL